jgi:hypothetical protein
MTTTALSASSLATSPEVKHFEEQLALLPQLQQEIQHDVFGGIYCRTGCIPAGVCFTGQVHKHDHINIVVGDITIVTDNKLLRLTGYNVLPTNAGSKRVAFTHTETFWTTILATSLTDIQAIEDWAVEDSSKLTTRLPQIKKD